MTGRARRIALVVGGVLALGAISLGVTSCSASGMEPYKDAAVSDRNTAPAVVGSMPDGFSNWARKCDGPNMVYVVYHSGAYGAISVVPNDPRCTK